MCFGKMLSFQWTNSLQSFFSSYRTGRTSRNSLHGYRRYSDTYWTNCKIIFLGLKRSKGIKLKKKKAIVPAKKMTFAHTFSNYGLWQTSRFFSTSTVFFGFCGACYENCSLTPRRLLKTQTFEIKLFFPRKIT